MDSSKEITIYSSDELSINGRTLQNVVDYMNHHKGKQPPIIPKPLRFKQMSQVTENKWDARYINEVGEDKQALYDLILAANYLDINSLLHLGCAKVASFIKGEPLESIPNILNPNPTTDESKVR